MKRYIKSTEGIFAMSMSRSQAIHYVSSFASTIMEHLVKLVLYSDVRKDDVSGWIHTIARCIHDVDDVTVKPRNKKLKPADFQNSLFSCMGDELKDYRLILAAFKQDNLNGTFNYEDKGSYPDFEVTHDLCVRLMTLSCSLMDHTLPLLRDTKDHSLEEYVEIINSIV